MNFLKFFNNKNRNQSNGLDNNKTGKQIIGKIGEDLACEMLRKEGFKVIDRNYLKKWGEIDIVAIKGKKVHFVEVKTVSRDTFDQNQQNSSKYLKNVTHETVVAEHRSTRTELSTRQRSSLRGEADDIYRPEDNLHLWKLQRLGRVIQSYLIDKDVSDETEWQFDIVTVYLDKDKNLIKIEILDDIVL